MTWGRGYGLPWGGGPLVELGKPAALAGGEPTSFVFTDEPDGPLPGPWEFYRLTHDVGGGTIDGEAEPDPDTYYRVLGGLGLWAYARSPVVGDPYCEQGVAASPSGVLTGRNARLSAVFRSAVLLNERRDSFTFEVVVGARLTDAGTRFVGGRVRAAWSSGGGWAPKLVVEAVQGDGGPLAVLATADLPDLPDLLDLWDVGSGHELTVELVAGELTVTLDGTVQVSAPVAEDGPAKPLLMARVYNQVGAVITPAPVFEGFSAQTLRDPGRKPPPPVAEGDIGYEAPAVLPTQVLTSEVLLDNELWKRVGARQFVARVEHTTEVNGVRALWREGDRVRAIDRVGSRTFIGVVPDLAAMRAS